MCFARKRAIKNFKFLLVTFLPLETAPNKEIYKLPWETGQHAKAPGHLEDGERVQVNTQLNYYFMII